MRKIIYDIATTLDNFVAREDRTVDGFIMEGQHAEEYIERIKEYDTVLMGKHTYEFGFSYGIEPGEPAYPNMMNYVFSRSTHYPTDKGIKVIRDNQISFIEELKQTPGSDIWLCGAGTFAGFLLDHQLIDQLILKVNPIMFGKGISLFGDIRKELELSLINSKTYENGVILQCYDIKY
ncbi:dihydrofolate reductase family protein [Chengkuizengella axinellae]|uniref:Dihydrofolate reductase family protein n=1 Tax=Chengkuizengella axinellae TaxID=3064388 RepID=A0ABT9J552_9BACL|nr:dihydrofolate reductase family protein [Chengkuizengella sp. 2205SS18-9]MDP5276747.1 dihydrofolate reductase family protein [Chengkuizengella sp. 2205SS18-9]